MASSNEPHVKIKQNANINWKPVTFKSDGDFDGLASITVLEDYEIIGGKIVPKSRQEQNKSSAYPSLSAKTKSEKTKTKKFKKLVGKQEKIDTVEKKNETKNKKPDKIDNSSPVVMEETICEPHNTSPKTSEGAKPESRKQRKTRLYKEKMTANKKQKKERLAANRAEDKARKDQEANEKTNASVKKLKEQTPNSKKRKSKNENKKSESKKIKLTCNDDEKQDSDDNEDDGDDRNFKDDDDDDNDSKDTFDVEKIKNEMTAWKDLFVPDPVLAALFDKGFTSPTPIQALTLPSAIRDRKDIIGAAETGSGKTLAFGIPLLNNILLKKMQANRSNSEESDDNEDDNDGNDAISAADDEGLEKDDITEQLDDNEYEDEESDGADESNDVDNEMEGDEDEDESLDGEGDNSDVGSNLSFSGEDEWDESELSVPVEKLFNSVNDIALSKDSVDDVHEQKPVISEMNQRLYCLILTPTRELAVQVKNHLEAAAKYTGIKVAVILGGMAPQKQLRILKRRPEIVVATPGRLWELIQEEEPHLSQGVKNLPFLVIDEADRMVEKGHFEELSNLLELINEDEKLRLKRQNLIFSATLTFVHKAPNWLSYKKKKKRQKPVDYTSSDKLDSLIMKIGIREKPKIVDLTRKMGTVETLTETKINCRREDKDIYLYYFLLLYPGRTLVFVNSKDCLRRLISILTLLKCNPLPLHADMHQKQRLKNLDKFTANPKALLLATDVAARGLDIPDVQHVIHYQVPKTTENYVHRSGRTARATKEGLSVMLVSPSDIRDYRKIVKALNKDEELPTFPVQEEYLPCVKERVAVTIQIDKSEHGFSKRKHENDWFMKAAKEADLDLDEELIYDLGDDVEKSDLQNKLKGLKMELSILLRQPVALRGYSGKYPTKSGKLQSIYMADKVTDALKTAKQEKDILKRLQTKSSNNLKKRRRKKKKVQTVSNSDE
ncbi:ATP-dependent RNA helicase DDX24-like [Tubulanus polymorphus]|uniref:ATP-dependent RNA helicase DDX24-like n=1 Tax=Tubulanus polymorphus TaxID=672921 RepID=UPI003DA21318